MPALSGGIILYSSRSAKSVACSRLNVIGVSAFFFLPVLVAALTSADEFHSVTNTRCPSALSHFASSPSCVVLPEPSMPSTTNSLPEYWCGVVRLFNMGLCCRFRQDLAYLHPKRLADQPLERRRVAPRRPQLELRVASRADLEEIVLAAIVQLETRDALRVAPIEALGQAQDRRQRAHDALTLARQIGEPLVTALRRGETMIARHERDR